MTENKISIVCPDCGCKDADVMYISVINGIKLVNYRCLAPGRKHMFTKPIEDNEDYKKFFKPDVYL